MRLCCSFTTPILCKHTIPPKHFALCRCRQRLAEAENLSARYKRVVEQNRALYNEVQDLKGNIRVFCRIR